MSGHIQEQCCDCACHAGGICLHVVPCCSKGHFYWGDPLYWVIGRMRNKIKFWITPQANSNQLVSFRKDLCA